MLVLHGFMCMPSNHLMRQNATMARLQCQTVDTVQKGCNLFSYAGLATYRLFHISRMYRYYRQKGCTRPISADSLACVCFLKMMMQRHLPVCKRHKSCIEVDTQHLKMSDLLQGAPHSESKPPIRT